MQLELKMFALILLLVTTTLSHGAQPEPNAKLIRIEGRRSSYYNEPANPKFRSANLDNDVQLVADIDAADDGDDNQNVQAMGNKDTSSGRLFLKKFMLFKNMFGNSNTRPIIPIIITGSGSGGGTGTTTTNPTTTITSTGTVPTATGTITTSPGTGTGRYDGILLNDAESADDDAAAINDSIDADAEAEAEAEAEEMAQAQAQALQAALLANAQEYIVTDDNIQGAGQIAGDTGKASRQPVRINLRRKASRRGQSHVISVRIPARYRRYFKKDQKVILNTRGRPGKRRVIRKRMQMNRRRGNKNKKNKNKKNKNKNKRTRVISA